MKKDKSLKQRLISSVVLLAMLFTSFVGTTFAWFTDSVTSAGNTIQAGTLKVDLLHKIDADWVSLKNEPEHKVFDYKKWEPGYTRVETLKIANLGTLALKYRLSVEVEAGTAVNAKTGEKLSDVIDVYVIYGESTETDYNGIVNSGKWTYKGTLTEVLRAPSKFINGELLATGKVLDGTEASTTAVGSQTVTIALHMQESAGNEYQNLSVGNIYVNLIATQWTGENDSFGSDYDKDSVFPELNLGGITVDVTTENNKVTTEATVEGEGVSAVIPEGVAVENGVNKLALSVTEKVESDANLSLNDGEALRSLDVHMAGVSKNNTVPMLITVEKAMKPGLNIGNYTLYHVENGVTVSMNAVNSLADLDAHNEFYYDPATGDVVLAMATFSEVDFIAEAAKWEGNFDYSWYTGEVATVDGDGVIEYTIANADQLAAFGAIVGGMAEGIERDSFAGKTVKLIADIDLGDKDDASTNLFYPIGYYNDAKSYTKPTDGTATVANVTSFQGTFDGNGHKISNFYQNTWQMWGNYDGNYYKAAMGLFGYVVNGTIKNLTVDNFSSDGEYTPTGVIAAYAVNSTFENIAITNCNPRVYNTGNGGIIGIAGRVDASVKEDIVLRNITVDNSNKISALWGSYDVACGGLVGMFRGNEDASGDTISFENCHVSAQIDVYNDVCGNYQYYAYRYAGMIIGSVRHNAKDENGKTIPNMSGISASGCTVNYGDWNDYYYCEFEKNGHPSYSGPDDYKFSRIPHSEINFTDTNGNGVIDADERSSVTGCKHNHTEAEDIQCVYLPFYQLFTGYSWGVSSIGLKEYSGIVTNLDITEGDQQESVEKFEGKVTSLVDYTTYKLGDIFTFVDNGVVLVPSALTVSIANKADNNPVSVTINYDKTDWANGTIKFVGAGEITITIQDYFFCTPTTITVVVTEHKHVYDNACDVNCNVCGATREVDDHVYDNDCDTTCNECGAVRGITHTYTAVVTDPTCTAEGYTTYTCECGDSYVADQVAALGHKYEAEVTAPTCSDKGYTTYTCANCNDSYVADEVAPNGHNYSSNVTAPDCVNGGYTTYTCSDCGGTYVADETAALGHKYEVEVTAPDCVNGGYTTYTCTVCDHSYKADEIAALGHKYNAVVTAPDCENGGYTTYTCSVCGDTYTDNEKEAIGHKYNVVVTAPTCTENGYTTYTCENCDDTYTDNEKEAIGHKYETTTVAPNCTTAGSTTTTCANCGDTSTEEIPATGHTYGEGIVTAPTCTENGYTTYTCETCGDSYTADITEAKHSYQAVVTAPTCTEGGYTTYTCSVCGYSYTANVTAAIGHNYTKVVTAPTCEKDGYTTYTCTCGDKYTGDETVALGHAFEFESKFNGDFLYRVGNKNTVALSSLFEVKNYDNINVEITSVTGASGTYNNDKTIQFTGTGIVKVKVTDNVCGKSTELYLEVVDAKNITSAASSIDGTDVVLLNDVKVSSGGTALYYNCTLYGNGFTFDVRGGMNKYNSKQGHGIIITKGATIDNLVVIGDVYDSYGAYTDQDDYTGAFDATSTVFTNCYIANCATPIRANGVTLIDTTLYGGTVANMIISGGTNTLTNVTTVNYNDSDRNVVGLGIVVADEAAENTKIILNGSFKQYNFVCSEDVSDVPGNEAKSVFNSIFNTSFSDYHIGSNPVYANTGIIIMTESLNTDIITDNANTGYVRNDDAKVTITYGLSKTVNGAIYAPGKNTVVDNNYVKDEDSHISTTQGVYQPEFNLDLGDYYDANDGETDTRYCYESIDDEEIRLLYQEGQNAFLIDLTKIVSVSKYGIPLTATVICKNSSGTVLATNSTVTLKDAGKYTFEIIVEDNLIYGVDGELTGESVSRTYIVDVELSVKKSSWKNAEITLKAPTNKSGYNSSKYYVLVFLEALSITDYKEDGTSEVVNLKAEYDSYEISYVNDSSNAWNGFTLTINYKDGRVLTVTFGAPSGLSSPGATAGGKTISLKNDNTYGYVLQSDGKISSKVNGTWPITSCSFKGYNTVRVENKNSVNITVDKNTTINVQSGSSGGGNEGGCVTGDTLVTLADGSTKMVRELTSADMLLVWDFFNGTYAQVPAALIINHGEGIWNVITLTFDDGTTVNAVTAHAFFDADINDFVMLTPENAYDYIGHSFVKANGDSYESVTLVDVSVNETYTDSYSLVSTYHYNFIVEGMFSLTNLVPALIDGLEIGEDMKYDEATLQADIETYGLYTYADFEDYMTEEQFNAFIGAYLKISVGKGYITYDGIVELIKGFVNP